MILDATVSLGNIINLLALVIAVGAAAVYLERRLTRVEEKVDVMWRAFLFKHPELDRVFLPEQPPQ